MRGDIYELRSNKTAVGHEQRGKRYAVVVQSDLLPLSTVIAAPTSTSARENSFRPEIELKGAMTRVLLEQLHAIDVEQRLGRRVGRLNAEEQESIDRALKLVLGVF